MPTNSKEYMRKNYKKYWWQPHQIADRSKRVQARRIMEKKWLVHKGDWKEVDHKNWIKGWNGKGNLRVVSRLRNRRDWQKKSTRAKLRKRINK